MDGGDGEIDSVVVVIVVVVIVIVARHWTGIVWGLGEGGIMLVISCFGSSLSYFVIALG